MSDEFIAYIILILEIQIESTLCNACLAYYIRNGSLAEAFGSEIFKSSFSREDSFICLLTSTLPIFILLGVRTLHFCFVRKGKMSMT